MSSSPTHANGLRFLLFRRFRIRNVHGRTINLPCHLNDVDGQEEDKMKQYWKINPSVFEMASLILVKSYGNVCGILALFQLSRVLLRNLRFFFFEPSNLVD